MALSHSTSQEKWGGADGIVLSDPCVGILNGTVPGYVQKVWADFVKCYESGKRSMRKMMQDLPRIRLEGLRE